MTKTQARHRLLVATALVLAVAFTVSPLLAEHRQEVARTFAARDGLVVELENLAGRIEVEGTSGGEVAITATVVAEDRALADKLQIDFSERGDRLVVSARYPVDEHDAYVYPGAGDGGSWLPFGGSRTNTRYQDEDVTVTSKARGGAVTLYADFVLRLPHGVGAKVENKVGDFAARGVHGRLEVDTGSGRVLSEDGEGRFEADTGSGDVVVRHHRGDVSADTGSGDVELSDIQGSVDANTGSGDVTLSQIDGEQVTADTGSGDVELADVGGELDLDTGSGHISGRDVRVRGRLRADTGSGGVDLRGDFSAVRSIDVDTGSGGVTLEGSFPGLNLDITTGSGSIDVDLPGLEVTRKARDLFKGSTGGGGADVVIETGSGSVRISG